MFGFTSTAISQGVIVKPGTAVTIENGTLMFVANGDKLLIEDDATHAPSFLRKDQLDIRLVVMELFNSF